MTIGAPCRSEDLQAAGAEDIDHPGGEWRLGADDGKAHPLSFGEAGKHDGVGKIDVRQPPLSRRTGISGSNVNLLDARALCQAPGHGVFTATRTDD